MKRLSRILFIVALVVAVVFLYLFVTKRIFPDKSSFIPPIGNSQPAIKMSAGETPSINFSLPEGFSVRTFATDLSGPRDMVFTPEGTLLVSFPMTDSVIAFPDKNKDGVADEAKTILSGLDRAHGIAFHNGKLYVAGVEKVARYSYDEANFSATLDRELFTLPRNNMHDKRSIIFNDKGQMFVSVPSSCNVCNQDLFQGGSVIVSDADGKKPVVYSRGLRNSPFFAINPDTGDLWATEMGRDQLGDDTPPDEVNILMDGKDYGWPNCYSNQVKDTDFNKSSQNPCGSTVSPILQIPAHSAPLGLAFIDSPQFPADWQNDLLIAYHGSWNSSVPKGFKVVRANVEGNTITSTEDFMGGFQEGPDAKSAYARPADLIFDKDGNLYLSDDKGGNIFIIQKGN